jgi:hypothetical protein
MIEHHVHLNAVTMFQNMLSLTLTFFTRKRPRKLMNVTIWLLCIVDPEIFRCCKENYANSIIVTNFVWIFIPNCRFKNIYLPTSALKFPNIIFVWYLGNLWNTHSSSSQKPLWLHQFYPLLEHKRREQWYEISDLSVLCMTSYHYDTQSS